MAPTLLPGDRVLVDRGAYRGGPPKVGDLIVLADPEARVRWLVKRVSAVDRGRQLLEVRGDNADLARDSRSFGPVPIAAAAGRVYRRYYPPERADDL